MNINRTICPFNHRACINCTLYRGRHQCSGVVQNINDKNVLDELEKMLQPDKAAAAVSSNSDMSDLKDVRITYVNVEDMTSQDVFLTELKEMDVDWDSTFMMRKIAGIHIYSWESLLKVVKHKIETENNYHIELVESPAHMLYGGGC